VGCEKENNTEERRDRTRMTRMQRIRTDKKSKRREESCEWWVVRKTEEREEYKKCTGHL
jgi:hypothetical protein